MLLNSELRMRAGELPARSRRGERSRRNSPSRQQRQVGAAPWTGSPGSGELPKGAPVWLRQPCARSARVLVRGLRRGRSSARSAPATLVRRWVGLGCWEHVDLEDTVSVLKVEAPVAHERAHLHEHGERREMLTSSGCLAHLRGPFSSRSTTRSKGKQRREKEHHPEVQSLAEDMKRIGEKYTALLCGAYLSLQVLLVINPLPAPGNGGHPETPLSRLTPNLRETQPHFMPRVACQHACATLVG